MRRQPGAAPGTHYVSLTPQGWVVKTVSGEDLFVQTEAEARWYNSSRDSYLEQTRFSETTDLRDLDRLLIMELMVFRMGHQLAAGEGYNGFDFDETLYRRNIREYSEQINKTKASMGLTKAVRDEAANAGDLSTYISNLKARAKLFGIHRENQLTKALVLMNELSSIVGAFDRSDKDERERLGFESETEILNWVRETMLPEFKAIDDHFRENAQRYWIREQ